MFFLTVFLAPDVVSLSATLSVFAFLPLVSVLTDDVAHLRWSTKSGAIGIDVRYVWWIRVIVCQAWYWKSGGGWRWMMMMVDDGGSTGERASSVKLVRATT